MINVKFNILIKIDIDQETVCLIIGGRVWSSMTCICVTQILSDVLVCYKLNLYVKNYGKQRKNAWNGFESKVVCTIKSKEDVKSPVSLAASLSM